MDNTTLLNIPVKYQTRVMYVDLDDDGWWIVLNDRWCWDYPGLHTIHEDTKSAALQCLRETKVCDCKECKGDV